MNFIKSAPVQLEAVATVATPDHDDGVAEAVVFSLNF
jgi:hypothetical protein